MPDSPLITLTLAQEAPLQSPGSPPPAQNADAAKSLDGGAANGGAAPGPGGLGSGNIMMLIVLMVLAMFVFSMMGQRRERRRREAMINAIKKHDRVQTIGGVIGSVVEVKPDYVVLKVDESSNTRITFARSAVQQVLTSSPEAVAAKADGEK
jgi:preprotein translocase subunit YajC